MNIKIKKWYDGPVEEIKLEDYLFRQTRAQEWKDSDYNQAFISLVDKLAEKGIINLNDVKEIFGISVYDNEIIE